MQVVLAQKPRSQCHLRVCPQRGEPAVASYEGSHIAGPPDSSHFSPQLQEKRIYDLKKKNQELEKFKFVLDYKIKELKKQIEPRENEIKVMKEQIQEVRSHCPHPALSDQLPPPRVFLAGLGVMKPPHRPSAPKVCAASTPQRVPQRRPNRGFSCAKAKGLCHLACRVFGVGSSPTSTSACILWASKGRKPRLRGLWPPGGDVYSATRLSHQKGHPSYSMLFLRLEMLVGAICKPWCLYFI